LTILIIGRPDEEVWRLFTHAGGKELAAGSDWRLFQSFGQSPTSRRKSRTDSASASRNDLSSSLGIAKLSTPVLRSGNSKSIYRTCADMKLFNEEY
jgi:hypothetical protein